LNADLDIESAHELTPLARELDPKAVVLHCHQFDRRWFMTVESLSWEPGAADQRIHELCHLIERLSPAGRALWYSATKREFDVGYDTNHGGLLLTRFALRSDTVGRIAQLGATLAVSVYRPDLDEALGSTPNPTTL
jgi:hypothetical protein